MIATSKKGLTHTKKVAINENFIAKQSGNLSL